MSMARRPSGSALSIGRTIRRASGFPILVSPQLRRSWPRNGCSISRTWAGRSESSSPASRPDGRWIVFVTRRTNYQTNRFERALVLVDVATGTRRGLTPGRLNPTDPQWSPAGDRITFVDAAPGTPAQLYVIAMGRRKARQLTMAVRGVTGYAWRPDARAIAFLTEDEAEERTGEERHTRSFEVGDHG